MASSATRIARRNLQKRNGRVSDQERTAAFHRRKHLGEVPRYLPAFSALSFEDFESLQTFFIDF
jgi:hypothetical protein